MTIKLYEFSTSRSARVRWILQEIDVSFEGLTGMEHFTSEEFKKVSPRGKIPVLVDGDKSLLESAAITTWLADSHPEKGLSFPSGTWERALHDQWVSFTLAELEAHLWSTFRNVEHYPEDRRVPEIVPQNKHEAKKALKSFEIHLGNNEYMVGNRFSVTDIIVGYALNWSEKARLLKDDYPNISAYLERVRARPACTLKKA